jgi:transcriptional regulator with XRE-family HTH domain
MSGKPTRHTPTREGLRFSWLLKQLYAKGYKQAQLVRITGLSQSHISQLQRLGDGESAGRTGIGAEIVRKVKDSLQIDPAYFFDDYEGEKPHELFLLSAKRDEKRVSAIETAISKIETMSAGFNLRLSQLEAQNVELKHSNDDLRRENTTLKAELSRRKTPARR